MFDKKERRNPDRGNVSGSWGASPRRDGRERGQRFCAPWRPISGGTGKPLTGGPVEELMGTEPVLIRHASAALHPVAQVVVLVTVLTAPLDLPEGGESPQGPVVVVRVPEEIAGGCRLATDIEHADTAEVARLSVRVPGVIPVLSTRGNPVLDEACVDVASNEKLAVLLVGECPGSRGNHGRVTIEELDMLVTDAARHDVDLETAVGLTKQASLALARQERLDGHAQGHALSTCTTHGLVEQIAMPTHAPLEGGVQIRASWQDQLVERQRGLLIPQIGTHVFGSLAEKNRGRV